MGVIVIGSVGSTSTNNGVGKTKWSVGASFAPTTDLTSLALTATAIDGSTFDALNAQIPVGPIARQRL